MSTCQRCGAFITWRSTEAGNWQPFNRDGTLHFPTCRARVADQRKSVRRWYAELRARSQIVSQEQ
jgi:hypothetical protein